MKRAMKWMAACALLCATVSWASADVIATWDYSTTAVYEPGEEYPNTYLNLNHVQNGVSVTDWTNVRPGGGTEPQYSDQGHTYTEATSNYYYQSGAYGWEALDAFDSSFDYLNMSVTALSGYTLTLSSLDYNEIWAQWEGTVSTYRLGYSLDNGQSWTYSSERQVGFNEMSAEYWLGQNTMRTWDFDADVTLNSGETMLFALWAYGETNIAGGPTEVGNDGSIGSIIYVSEQGNNGAEYQLNGSAVPEPSTYAMIGVGLAMLLWRMRRREVSA